MQKRWNIILVPNTAEQGFNLSLSARDLKLGAFIVLAIAAAAAAYAAISLNKWEGEHAGVVSKLREEIPRVVQAIEKEMASSAGRGDGPKEVSAPELVDVSCGGCGRGKKVERGTPGFECQECGAKNELPWE